MWIIIDILITILLFYLINKRLKIITITPYEKLYHTLYHIVVGKECSGGTKEQRSCTPPTQSNY